MTCRVEMESEEGFSCYLQRVPEQEAYDALGKLWDLARNFERQHKPTADRMHKMFDAGCIIYKERFGQDWVPF